MLFAAILVASFIAQLFLPWWSLPVVAVVAAFFLAKGYRHACWQAFAAGLLLWGGVAFCLNLGGSAFADQMSSLLFLPDGWFLVLITGVLGGLLATLGVVLGYAAHGILKS